MTRPPSTPHLSHITFHVSRFTPRISRITLHVSRFTHHASRITFHVSLLLLLTACMPSAGENIPTFIPPPTTAPQQGLTHTVEAGTLSETVQARGRMTARQEMELVFPLAGVLRAVYVAAGDRVEAGAPLAELDAPALRQDVLDRGLDLTTAQLDLDRAQAMATAEASLAEAQLDQARAAYEANPDALTRSALAVAETTAYSMTVGSQFDIDIARAQVDWAEARLDLATEQLTNTLLVAPFGGQIISIEKGPGDAVGAYESIGAIADPSELWIVASVSTEGIDQLSAGHPVTVRLDAYPTRTYAGSILQIAREAVIWQGRAAYEVTVVFDAGQDVPPIIGMGADVFIAGPALENVPLVPSRALISIAGQTYVELVKADGQIERVAVQTGLSTDGQTEILSGLQAGQVIRVP